MTAIAIDRFVARYAIPRAAPRARLRLQAVVSDALGRVLEGAIERTGLSRDAHVCIRDVHAAVTVALREPDAALADRIAERIAAAIHDAAADAGRSVVYASRAHALIDLAVHAAQGVFDRSWAWRQLGLWRADGPLRPALAADAVLRTLAAEPAIAIAAAAHLARRHTEVFEALVTRATVDAWIAVARASLDAVGAAGNFLESDEDGGDVVRGAADPTAAAAARIAGRSAIARAVARQPREMPVTLRRALAVMSLLEVEPAHVRGHAAPVRRMVAAVLRALLSSDTDRQLERAADDPRSFIASHQDPEATAAASASTLARTIDGDGGLPAAVTLPVLPGGVVDEGNTRDSILPAIRLRATSDAAGLMYLVTLVDRLDVLNSLLADGRLALRGSRWVLHQLGMALAGVEPSDAAVLAFAGLPPDSTPPSAQEAPPGDEERVVIVDARAAIVRALHELLDRQDRQDREDAHHDPVAFVCRRTGEIIADPGWIDVRFRLDQVSTAIRRTGLDRDPGWVPWLGVAVRFLYE